MAEKVFLDPESQEKSKAESYCRKDMENKSQIHLMYSFGTKRLTGPAGLFHRVMVHASHWDLQPGKINAMNRPVKEKLSSKLEKSMNEIVHRNIWSYYNEKQSGQGSMI